MKNNLIKNIISHFSTVRTSRKERITFWQWLFATDQHEEKEEALLQIWHTTPEHPDSTTLHSLEKIMKKLHLRSNSTSPKVRIFRQIRRIAAILIIPLGISIATWIYVQKTIRSSDIVEVATSKGEQKSWILPDGSKVILNAGSILLHPHCFMGETRTVHLFGEAHFDVAKDPKHPFIVKTSQIAVTALGTKFNVQAYPDGEKIIATLEQGAISVQRRSGMGKTFLLKPNEQIEYDLNTFHFKKNEINAKVASGWTRGELNFVNCPLKEIVAHLERHYKVDITVDTRLYTTDLYTIKFKKGEPLREVIEILTLTVGGMNAHFENEQSIALTAIPKVKKGGRPA